MKQYDPSQVIIKWAGYTFSGFAEDEMITITPNSEKRGVAGSVTGGGRHVKYLDTNGVIQLKLNDYTPDNDFMTGADFANLDAKFSVIDKSSNLESFISTSAMVKKMPDFEKGKNPKERIYELNYINGIFKFSGGAE